MDQTKTTTPWQHFLACIALGNDAQTELAAQALQKEGDAVLPNLEALLAQRDPDRRWWAVRALASVGTPAAYDRIVTALGDPQADVRAAAAQGLGELGERGITTPEAIAALIHCLDDPSSLVARIAADGLARIGAPAVPALIAALQSTSTPVRAGAARALSIIQPEEAVPALCAALDDPSATVTYYVEEALERMGVGLILFAPHAP